MVEFTITQKITKEEYLTATFGAFAMFLGAYILVILGIHFEIIQGCIIPPFFVKITFSSRMLALSEKKCTFFFR